MSTALLLADREPSTRVFLERHLRHDGFEIVPVTGRKPDLVIASDDVDLERWRGEAPVIVLGRLEADLVDRVRAFREGCDDYLPRPFHYDELVERIRAVLRRVRPEREMIVAGAIAIDLVPRIARVHGVPVPLSKKEYALLVCLAADPHRVFTKRELLRDVWDYPVTSRTRTVDAHACRVRRKLRVADPSTPYIETVWGTGYRLLGLHPD
jgi:DNA-binding response OmpR family regulator